jgi:hypothetical protein
MGEARKGGAGTEEVKTEQVAELIRGNSAPLLKTAVVAGIIFLLLELVLMVSVRPAVAQSAPVSAGVRLQAGIEKEEVDGDLKSAMDIYQRIAADISAPRDVRAHALLRLAGCEEKLGREAKHVYEQIVHDYADQPAALQARKRLAMIQLQEHPAPPTTMTTRKIEYGKIGSIGPTDTDGSRAVYWSSENLYFGDIAGRNRRLILSTKHYGWIPCRDFSLVVLNLLALPDRPHTLALIKTDGTGYRELIRDNAKNSIFGQNQSFAMSCSWDDRNLLLSDFSLQSAIPGQLWIVSVADGTRRVLADVDGGRVRKAVFSPNGQFVAYDVQPRGVPPNSTSRVFVVPVRGGEPRLVYEATPWQVGNQFLALMDWTADGRYLAIRDIRQGRSALYLLPMKDGAPDGPASFVRYGDFDEGYTTAAGALVYKDKGATLATQDVLLGSIDPDGRFENWHNLELNLNGDSNPWPSFSPDRTQIAYITRDADRARRDLIVRDLSTGQERVAYQSLYGSLGCQFSAITPNIFCSIEKESGKTDLISVAADSGAVGLVATLPGSRFLLQPSRDDQTFFFSGAAWLNGYLGRLSSVGTRPPSRRRS